MTEQLEQVLRHVFAEDAEQAPVSATLAQGALRRVRQRRNAQLAWAAGAAAATVAVAVVGGGLLGGQPVGHPLATPPAASKGTLPSPTGIARTGPLDQGNGSASCVEAYSLTSLKGRAFAFDGTVTSIGPARSNRPGVRLDLVAATFTVNEWFRGGSSPTVTVDMSPPRAAQPIDMSAGAWGPSYGVGTRLLVSGEPRWGGAPLDDAIAWEGCGGFTRYFDKVTADSWRAAFD